MSLVPFDAFVDPGGRPVALLRFSGGPTSGLLARRESTWIHSGASVGVGVGVGAGAGAVGVGAGAKLKIKDLFVC
jgi:hypothetical protein